MDEITETMGEFLARHQEEVVDYGTDWVISQALDLRGSRPREETHRLVSAVAEFNRKLLLDIPSGLKTRATFIDFVTSYRASRQFKVSTLLRGFLSFKKGVQALLAAEDMPLPTKMAILDRVDEVYYQSIFRMSDVYVDKLKSVIEERQEQLRARDRKVALLERELTESLLKRFLAPSVVDDIVHGRRSLDQKPRGMHVTVLFADLVGFSSVTQQLGSDALAAFINDYLTKMSEQVFYHQGTVDKFMGDTVMALFGAPVAMAPKEQAIASVRCAANMQRALLELESPAVGELSMRIGIDAGPVVVGAFGSTHRSDFTAMGMPVNRAHQLGRACQEGEIYVTSAVARYLPEATEPCGTTAMKGQSARIPCFRVTQARVAF